MTEPGGKNKAVGKRNRLRDQGLELEYRSQTRHLMHSFRVAVLAESPDLLVSLRELAEGFDFFVPSDQPGEEARFLIVEGDLSSASIARTASSQILRLTEGQAPQRQAGEVFVSRKSFLSSPVPYLELCRELIESRETLDSLRERLEFSEQVQQLLELTDLERVFETITRNTMAVLRLKVGTMLLHDARIERYVEVYNNDPAHLDSGEFVPGVSNPLLRSSIGSRHQFAVELSAEGKGTLAIPIQVQDDMIGVLKFPFDHDFDHSLIDRAVRYLRSVTAVLANTYQLTRSKELAMRDDLTKAFNRRFFDSYLEEEIERSRRYGAVFSIIFLDLDDLKLVNSKHGHLAGSRTLQEVAKRILAAVRAIDKVVRFGGDEFCIILPQTDQDQAKAVANRVRKSMVESSFRLDADIDLEITASFGIASYPLHAVTKEDLIKCADAAMYHVKSTTKNSIGVAPAPRRASRKEVG